MKCDKVDYQIHGNDLQAVEIELDPKESIIAEAGAMSWMEEDISFEVKLGDGSDPDRGLVSSFFGSIGRVLTGESLFMTHFTNINENKKRKVTFSSALPGKIMDVDLASLGGELLCQKDAFLCAAKGTSLEIAFKKKLGVGFFGGEGFILQKLQGDGMVFLQAGGTQVVKELEAGEKLRVDTGAITAFTPSISYDIEMVGELKSMVFGGEGLFLATLSGPGTVILQSLPFSKLADRVFQSAPKGSKAGGDDQGQ